MKIVCISDTHGLHNTMLNYHKLGEGNVLIHAGDLTNIGRRKEIEEAIAFLQRQLVYFDHVVFTSGNHDRGFDPMFSETSGAAGHIKLYYESDLDNVDVVMEKPQWLMDLIKDMDKRAHYLENSGVTINGLNFWGSPITPNFFEQYWAFNRTRGEKIYKYWDMIPQITDVLITHGPPYGIMDTVLDGQKVGCEELGVKINYDLPKLKLHVFGHIHDGYGKIKLDNKTFVNASTCTEKYVPKNPPIQVEL